MDLADKAKEFEKVGEGILEFYFKSYMDDVVPDIKKAAVSHSPLVDSDLVITAVDMSVNEVKKEFSLKINLFLLLVMGKIAQGDFDTLRKFETLFIDLIHRILNE